MKHHKKLAVLSSALVIGSITGVYAQTNGSTPTSSPSPSASPSPSSSTTPSAASAVALITDAAALNFLHYANNSEINDANEALQRLTNQQAINFAQTMVTDHQQNEQLVTQTASQTNMTLYPFQPSTVDLARDSELQKLSGTQYDRAYLTLQLAEHQKTLRDLQFFQSQVTDPTVKNLINQTIPVIQKHIALATSSLNSFTSAGPTSTPTPNATPSSGPSPSPSNSSTPMATPTPSGSPAPGSTM